jgi:transposase
MRTVELFEAGRRQADVVTELGVSAQTASRWHRAWQDGGRDALAGAARLGRTPRLSDEQLAEAEAALLDGPKANGFSTSMWTLARVADVIERVSGVRYTLSQTWLILRQRLGWTRQRPARRAVERDRRGDRDLGQAGLAQDKKGARRSGAWICFADESGCPLLPVVRGAWAPRGQTPVLRHRFSWSRMSMAGVLAYRPGPLPRQADLPDQPRQLQHRKPHRVPHPRCAGTCAASPWS